MRDLHAKRGMFCRVVGSMIVIRQNKETSSDQDWDDFLDILVAHRGDFARLKILVVTDGGGPSVAQRKRLEVALDDKPVRVAVVSDSMRTRFVVSSIALLNPEMSSFRVTEMSQAYDHLSLTLDERSQAKTTLEQLSARIR
jgi:hypothetical protein